MQEGANWAEIGAALATAVLHLLISGVLDLQALFIALTLPAWTAYVVWRARQDRAVLSRWGFTRRNLRPALMATGLLAVAAIVAMALVGRAQGSLAVPGHLALLLSLYPIWGLLQQLLVQAMVARNLRRTFGALRSPAVIVPTCAVLFGLVHVPQWEVVGATFLMGLAFTPIYLKWQNLWPLGVFHGWLGALFYVWVLERDPWTEVFG